MHIITGNNEYAVKQFVARLTKEFVQKNGDLALEKLDGSEVVPGQIDDAINSMPFLSSRKMVVASDVQSKDVLEHVSELEVPDTTELIVIAPKMDKRAGYYKKLSKLEGFHNFEVQESFALPRWVAEETKRLGGTISSSDARYLVERVGSDQMLLASEIDKLITYDPNVTRETIALLTEPTPQSTVFQLLDAAFRGDRAAVEQIYTDQRAQKVEPLAIIGMLTWQLHVLAVIKTAGDRTAAQIAKEARISPFVVKKSMNIARGITLRDVQAMVEGAVILDEDLKTKKINADAAMLNYLMSLSSVT